ncbi:peptide methionine sulfoxide reductase A1 [Selaginella moellendorffii]|nr:peptide methionine sulfoxide reductase A1 [Selaginella moellendorffii]|eukprot:XP_002969802.2 peptide methionine sulfoxide reductase A1 [Selaginella moellendorffii]
MAMATFAAGCFWSVELAFQRIPGVIKTTVGYTQGSKESPTYHDVCTGRTGHAEAVLVEYDPKEVSYTALLDAFWKKHDPTQADGQGNDLGSQYRSGIYFHTPEQEKLAKQSLEQEQQRLGKKIVTELLPATTFYPAEDYHQQYLEKGGRGGRKQSAAKGCTDPIRCYG